MFYSVCVFADAGLIGLAQEKNMKIALGILDKAKKICLNHGVISWPIHIYGICFWKKKNNYQMIVDDSSNWSRSDNDFFQTRNYLTIPFGHHRPFNAKKFRICMGLRITFGFVIDPFIKK